MTCEKCNRVGCQNCFEFGEDATMGYACDSCSRTLCVDCVPLRECTYLECSKEMCAECAEKGGEDVVHRCIGGCGDMILCNKHRVFEF